MTDNNNEGYTITKEKKNGWICRIRITHTAPAANKNGWR